MTEYTTENPLRLIELFAGIGSQTQALTNIGIAHKVVAISEIDKYAIQSYEAMHGKANNLGDIRKIEELPNADLWTYSFPCQDISVAGKRVRALRKELAAACCLKSSDYCVLHRKREHSRNTYCLRTSRTLSARSSRRTSINGSIFSPNLDTRTIGKC